MKKNNIRCTGSNHASLSLFNTTNSTQHLRPTAIIIQNHPSVGLGTLEAVLRERHFNIIYYNSNAEDVSNIPHEHAELVIVLGATAGAYEHDKYPWLEQVETLIKRRMDSQLPLLGSCLGGQLIAQVLGAKVYPSAAHREIGYYPLQLTNSGQQHNIALFAEHNICVAESHGDIFDLPEGAELLASTERNPNQVFTMGNALAFQFHPEATAEMFENWMQLWQQAAEKSGKTFDTTKPLQEMQQYAQRFEARAKLFFEQYIDDCILKNSQQLDHTMTLSH